MRCDFANTHYLYIWVNECVFMYSRYIQSFRNSLNRKNVRSVLDSVFDSTHKSYCHTTEILILAFFQCKHLVTCLTYKSAVELNETHRTWQYWSYAQEITPSYSIQIRIRAKKTTTTNGSNNMNRVFFKKKRNI